MDSPENGAPETAVRRESYMRRRSSRLSLAPRNDGISPDDEDSVADDSSDSSADDVQQDAQDMSFDITYWTTNIYRKTLILRMKFQQSHNTSFIGAICCQ